MKRTSDLWLYGVVCWVLLSFGLSGYLRFRTSRLSQPAAPRYVSDFKAYQTPAQPVTSPPPTHTLVFFTNYACRGCRSLKHTLDSLRLNHPEVALIERQFIPDDSTSPARLAAAAAMCGARVGRYTEMSHRLFDNTILVADKEWGAIAAGAGIPDTSALVACVKSGRFDSDILTDTDAAHRLGLRRAPALLIDDSLFTTPPPPAALSARLISRGDGHSTKR